MDTRNQFVERLNELYTKLNELTVGTQEYDKVLTQYLNLYRVYEEAEKNENKRAENALKQLEIENNFKIEKRKGLFDLIKLGVGAICAVLSMVFYRIFCDKTGDPYFRDIGRTIIGWFRKA